MKKLPTTSKKMVPFLNFPFWKFLGGVFAILAAKVLVFLYFVYFLMPTNAVMKLSIEPRQRPDQPKLSFQVPNFTKTNSLSSPASGDSAAPTQLHDIRPFPSLTMIDSWMNTQGRTIDPKAKTIRVVSVGRMHCSFCLDFYPYLGMLQRRYAGKVEVLAVLYQKYDGELSPELIQKHVDDNLISIPLGLDTDNDFMKSLNVDLVPVTYVIDSNNTVVYEQFGLGDFSWIDQTVGRVLEKEGR